MEREKLIKVRDGLYTTPLKEGEKSEFRVVITDLFLVHPDIIKDDTTGKISKLENYKIRNGKNYYDGTHKGQYILGLIFNSITEMYEFKELLDCAGYRTKINWIDKRVFREVLYNIDNINKWDYTNLENILTVRIRAVDLEKYKRDLLRLGFANGYRFVWADSNRYIGFIKKTFNPIKFNLIID